jgi:hypothetical protein
MAKKKQKSMYLGSIYGKARFLPNPTSRRLMTSLTGRAISILEVKSRYY